MRYFALCFLTSILLAFTTSVLTVSDDEELIDNILEDSRPVPPPEGDASGKGIGQEKKQEEEEKEEEKEEEIDQEQKIVDDIEFRKIYSYKKRKKIKEPPLEVCNKLFPAIQRSDLFEVKSLIKQGCSPNYYNDKYGTAIVYVINTFNNDILNYLIESGANVNLKFNQEKTLLHFAAEAGNYEAFESLFAMKASLSAKDKNGKTPIDCITKHHSFFAEAMIGPIQDINIALVFFAKYNWLYGIRYTLFHDAYIDYTDKNGKKALMYAVQNKSYNAIKVLLLSGSSLEIKTLDNMSVYEMTKDPEIINLLKTAEVRSRTPNISSFDMPEKKVIHSGVMDITKNSVQDLRRKIQKK